MFKHSELGTNADLCVDDTVQLSTEHGWSSSDVTNPVDEITDWFRLQLAKGVGHIEC